VKPVRCWVFELADARMVDVYKDYDFDFFFQIITLSGEVVRNARNRSCCVLMSSWKSSFDRVWADVHHVTGGRIRQMVFGDISVDNYNRFGFRWSHLLQRSDARAYSQESPLYVTVLLR
jgi:hypothetical protein